MGSGTPKRPAPNNGGKTAAGTVTKPVDRDQAVLKRGRSGSNPKPPEPKPGPANVYITEGTQRVTRKR